MDMEVKIFEGGLTMLFLDRVMMPPPSVWGLLVGLASGWDGGTKHVGDGGEVEGDSECPGEGWTRHELLWVV